MIAVKADHRLSREMMFRYSWLQFVTTTAGPREAGLTRVLRARTTQHPPGIGCERQRLSAVVCARNEAGNLAACLAQLRFADEIVVLLDRSTDSSTAIAHALADRIIEGVFPLEGPRRTAAVAASTGDWVLEIDADERVPSALADEIRSRLSGPVAADWFLIPVENYVGGRLIRHGWGGSFGTSATVRLYRRGAKTWSNGRVHPHTYFTGHAGGRLRHAIEHRVDADVAGMFGRLERYTRLRAIDLQDRKRRPGLLSHGFRGLRRFWKCYVTRRGYREGDWGVLIALMAALYPVISELRARLESPAPEPASGAASPIVWIRTGTSGEPPA